MQYLVIIRLIFWVINIVCGYHDPTLGGVSCYSIITFPVRINTIDKEIPGEVLTVILEIGCSSPSCTGHVHITVEDSVEHRSLEISLEQVFDGLRGGFNCIYMPSYLQSVGGIIQGAF